MLETLIFLSRMVESYPTRPTLANRLLSALGPLQEESYHSSWYLDLAFFVSCAHRRHSPRCRITTEKTWGGYIIRPKSTKTMELMTEGKNITQIGGPVSRQLTFGSRKIIQLASTWTEYARKMVNGSTMPQTIIQLYHRVYDYTNLQLNTQCWMYPMNMIQMSATFLML